MLDRRLGRLGWAGLCGLLLFRLWFSAALPLTGDEAYFVLWGEHLAGGYYDHPPMVGWWLSGLLAWSRAEWALRLPATLLPLVLAAGGWWLVRPYGAARARWAAVLIVLQPANVWNVLITTDTPLIFFSWLSVLAYVAALRSPGRAAALGWHAVAGALLGLAFLGKYLAALLGFAYVVHVLFVRRDGVRRAGFLLLLAASLPALAYNLWWNSRHCWVNILFNVINRHEGSGFFWGNPPLYVLSLLYLATPWMLWFLFQERRAVAGCIRASVEASAVFWLMLLPLGLFALMSLGKTVGLHWLLSFVPLLAVLAALSLDETLLARLARWSGWLALLHAAVFFVALQLPYNVWKGTRIGDGMALRAQIAEVKAQLAPFAKDHLLAMDSYSSGAYLAYATGRHVAVFGRGSFYARQDDFVTDWAAQDGRDVLVFSTVRPRAPELLPYFRSVELRAFEVGGMSYYQALGHGFKYPEYHDQVLKGIRDRHYRTPAWAPPGRCAFTEHYFPGVR